jgi:hypothetical protein
MSIKDFHNFSDYAPHEPPHRGISRESAGHVVAVTVLGVACAAGVLGLLWLLYAFG